MIRCDFASVAAIIHQHLKEDIGLTQTEFLYRLLGEYINSNEVDERDGGYIDPSLANKWLKGMKKPSGNFVKFYQDKNNASAMEGDREYEILPLLADRQACVNEYGSEEKAAVFMTKVLLFGMQRRFIPRTEVTAPSSLMFHSFSHWNQNSMNCVTKTDAGFLSELKIHCFSNLSTVSSSKEKDSIIFFLIASSSTPFLRMVSIDLTTIPSLREFFISSLYTILYPSLVHRNEEPFLPQL